MFRVTRLLIALGLVASTAHADFAGTDAHEVVMGPASRVAPTYRNAPDITRVLPGWRGMRDRDTGVVGAMWGGRWSTPGASTDASAAEHWARAFILAHAALIAPGVSAADLVVAGNSVDTHGKRTVAFRVRWRGLEVVGSTVGVVIMRDAIFAAQSTVVPMADMTVSARAPRMILPIVRANGTITREVVDRRVSGGWEIFVGPDGRERMRRRLDHNLTATLAYDVGVQRPGGTRMAYPAREAAINVDATPTTTDAAGMLTFTGAGLVATSASGPRVKVVNGAGASATTTLTATDGQAVTWSAPTDELIDAQLSAFIHVSLGKAHARIVAPSIAIWLDTELTVDVNLTGNACNASADDAGLHFYRADAMCENTARVADIVYHELGHRVHGNSIIPGMGGSEAGLSEGLADFFAATLTGSPLIGRGLHLDDTAVRDIDPADDERVAPYDLVPVPHRSGLIISGALWDLRRALIAAHGEVDGTAATYRIFESVMALAPSIATSYMSALIGDDDDGDLGNGTPNQCAIEAAFARHGIAPDDVEVRELTVNHRGKTIEVVVSDPSTTCTRASVTGVNLTWQITSGSSPTEPATFAMGGGGRSWSGTIPGLPNNVLVRYSLEATFTDGTTLHRPDNRADRQYTLYTGPGEQIWCGGFAESPFEKDPPWTVGDTGGWQYGTPKGLAFDPASGYDGNPIVGNDILDDGRYDAMTTTTLSSPAIEIPAGEYDAVHLQFWRWLTVEDALYDKASVAVGDAEIWSNVMTDDGSLEHIDKEWRFVDYDITPYANGSVQAIWKLTADDSRSLGGWNIGSVCISGDPTESLTCSDDCEGEGCCSTSGDPAGALMLLGWLGLVVHRKRKRPQR